MGSVKKSRGSKLITGFIFKEEGIFDQARQVLKKKFGRIDFQSQTLDFTHTHFYQEEFGHDLKRVFISFEKLIPPDALPEIKIFTNKIEARLSQNSKRRINIDPGYLTQAKLVLATTKDYSHRIYLGKGIYAEITLFFQGRSFRPREWTYPDYKTDAYIKFFNRIREIYAQQI